VAGCDWDLAPEEDVNNVKPAALKMVHLLARYPQSYHLKELILEHLGVKDHDLETLLHHNLKRSCKCTYL
jgi:hypothetical protein